MKTWFKLWLMAFPVVGMFFAPAIAQFPHDTLLYVIGFFAAALISGVVSYIIVILKGDQG